MKRIFVPLIIVLLLTGVAVADRFTSAKGSFVKVEGTSSLHDWTIEGPSINGEVKALPFAQWSNGRIGVISSEVSVAIPVSSIKSKNSKMDKLMAGALKADKNPTIKYQLTRAVLATPGAKFVLTTGGKLTIAGVTRDVNMDVTGTREANGKYVLTGQMPVRMSDYGIKPPTAMLGTIRTGNDVKVSFRWAVEAAQ